MPIRVACPGCGRSLKAPDDYAGRTCRCPQCKTAVTLPAAAPPPEDDELYAIADAPADPPAAPAARAAQSGSAAASGTAPPAAKAPAPADPDATSASRRTSPQRWLYGLFAATLLPLLLMSWASNEDASDRLAQTLAENPDVLATLKDSPSVTREQLLARLPDHKIAGAHLASNTWVHWLYGLAAASVFLTLLLTLFPRGNADGRQLVGVGLATATGGILFLLAFQWIAEFTQGFMLRGGSIVVLLFYIVKFIGFSYHAASDPSNGFWLSFLGFTCGVGLCEEVTKLLPVVIHLRSRATLDYRGLCLWGLASGVGFGVAEGIMYSSDMYNGIATGNIYVVRFVSCVGLHAAWAGAAAVMAWRYREWMQSTDWEWPEIVKNFFIILSVPMILHGLYDTLLKKDMHTWALVAAAASFAWLILINEWMHHEEAAWAEG